MGSPGVRSASRGCGSDLASRNRATDVKLWGPKEVSLNQHVVYYYDCPVHPEVVLYTEDPSVIKMMLPDRPSECPKCKKYYYRHECKVREVRR